MTAAFPRSGAPLSFAPMSFLEREVPALGRRVFRLGLTPSYGLDEAGIRSGIDRGVNYFFYASLRGGALRNVIRDWSPEERGRHVVATTTTLGYFGWNVKSSVEGTLKSLRTDYVDVLQLGWLGVASAYTDATVRALEDLKRDGKVRRIGTSIHDRPRAGKLAEDSPLDLLMIRYNAAHPGAEREVFPSLAKRKPAVVAFTATRWGKLLKRPGGWKEAVPTAADCYRFCLSNENVDVVLCAPKTQAELDENFAGLARGPLSTDEQTWMRDFGKVVHG